MKACCGGPRAKPADRAALPINVLGPLRRLHRALHLEQISASMLKRFLGSGHVGTDAGHRPPHTRWVAIWIGLPPMHHACPVGMLDKACHVPLPCKFGCEPHVLLAAAQETVGHVNDGAPIPWLAPQHAVRYRTEICVNEWEHCEARESFAAAVGNEIILLLPIHPP